MADHHHTEAVEDTLPLSPMQQGMLFHSLNARHPGVDIEQILISLPEKLDVTLFQQAWQRIADRHTILRTGFRWRELDEPRQKIEPQHKVVLAQIDWRQLPQTEQQERFASFLQTDREEGFDLTAPPMRLTLIRFGDASYRLVYTFHHLLLDGRALVVVLKEVFEIYEALDQGKGIELPPPRSYGEYLVWLKQQDWSLSEQFWRKTLTGFTSPTPLAATRPAGDDNQHPAASGEQEILFDTAFTASLKKLAKDHRLSLNILVQGVWALLLSRYSGEEDVVFGVIRACRRSTIPDAESIVGLFINTVPMRVRMAAGLSTIRWLQQIRDQWLALRDHEHTPLVKIQNWSEITPGQPLFETIFNFQDPSWDTALQALGGKWAKRQLEVRNQSNYPLVVDAYGGSELRIKILYHRHRFDDEAIARMLGHLKTLLEGISAQFDEPTGLLPMLTAAERQQLLNDWNGPHARFPDDKCVHELFAEQARRTPEALAVADEERRLTYRELDESASLLAQELCQAGVGPDVLVGVCLPRSATGVVALLAVLKAGGAYVPLDPTYPPERLAFMLKDSQAVALLTQQSLHDQIKQHSPGLKVICVDRIHSRPGSGQTAPTTVLRPANSRNLAYAIYTSGSSGAPKGVGIEHRSLVNLITWHQRTYALTPTDRATQLASPAFDASVWELWPYLTAGASIHIPAEPTRLSSHELVDWLAKRKITLSFVPTPLAEAMINEPGQESLTLRALLTGGDKLHHPPPKDLPYELLNHYGPTENTVVTTWCSVPAGQNNSSPPPIGRPIANTEVYILDRHGRPVPIGVPGELHIGGTGLAREYLNRPDLTAEKFIANPFSDATSSRLYKTGDLVRWKADGSIEFLGRLDHQVKIRGNRIEPGEIESVLCQHPAAGQCIVLLNEDLPGNKRLVAYVVSTAKPMASAEELREFLREKLPAYMLPGAFVFLPTLPLTPNGKVDRNALPAPDIRPDSEAGTSRPFTPTEQTLSDIWHEVLGVKPGSVHADFFALGGHSLMAAQVIVRISNRCQVELPLHDLFDAPTVAGLAERIEAAQRGKTSRTSPAPASSATDNQLCLSPAQERIWFLEQFNPDKPANNIPLVFHLTGPLDTGALQQSLTEIVRRHQPLRTSFLNRQGHPGAVLNPCQPIRLESLNLGPLSRHKQELEQERFVRAEARKPFDLTQSPLLRAHLLQLANQEHLLLLTTHHIACDGWSMGIFHRELAALYEAYHLERSSPLSDLSTTYDEFTRWQRGQLQSGALQDQLAYWKQQMALPLPVLDLPADRPRPAMQRYCGEVKYFTLPTTLTCALQTLGRQQNVTLYMLMLAAFQTLLHRYSGQDDIIVGSPIAGRPQIDTEGLIGLFLNTLPLRGDLSGDPSFIELLKRTRQLALDAYAHQDVPFEKLVDALKLDRDLSGSPLFRVMLVLQNEPLPSLELAGLKVTPQPVHSGTAKFDLTLSLESLQETLSGYMEYNSDLFDEETIGRMIGHFQTLLESIVTRPEQRLSRLPLLTDNEHRHMTSDWNRTEACYPCDKCLHEIIEEQARRTPDRIAVMHGHSQLTYRELDEQADMVAEHLRNLGVGPEMLVGICVERSLEMLPLLLGILKADGAYLPLDPTYPSERLAFMLQDSQAKVLITQNSLLENFRGQKSKLTLVCLEEFQLRTHKTNRPTTINAELRAPHPYNLAYVIYTSGSTGQPKGVMVTHRNAVNFLQSMQKQPGLAGTDVLLAVTTLSFDIAGLELFLPLTVGARVLIASREDTSDGRRLSSLMERFDITVMQATPATWRLLFESGWAGRKQLKVLCGGEALPRELADRLFMSCGEVWNLYGPTETTIWSAVHRVILGTGPVPIGRPIANTQFYLLDRHLQPVPVGVPGELHIGGDGVARGYLNRPDLTGEKFIPDPFSSLTGARLYKTGDQARYLPDGSIEFLGRLDHQIKLRGHRIELGEIEARLRQHPGVRQCAVVVREDAPGDQRIAAYVVPAQSEPPPASGTLRSFLAGKLPDYMLPSAFVFLTALPLTPNKKVDRKALPKPDAIRSNVEAPLAAPRTQMEKTIAAIWRELLRVEQIGLTDNFFDLGGHSLLVVQAQARLSEALGMDIPVVKLFQHPTVETLAQFLDAAPESDGDFHKLQERAARRRATHSRRQELQTSLS